MRRAHSHQCTCCGQDYDCGGTLSRNHDGWPEVVCSVYHEAGDTECAACDLAPRCAWCGRPGSTVTSEGEQVHPECIKEQLARKATV